MIILKRKEWYTYTLTSQQMAKFCFTLRSYSVITPTHTNTQQMDQIQKGPNRQLAAFNKL